jgi:hypothetical protein
MKTGSLQKADGVLTTEATASISNSQQRNAHGDVDTVTKGTGDEAENVPSTGVSLSSPESASVGNELTGVK